MCKLKFVFVYIEEVSNKLFLLDLENLHNTASTNNKPATCTKNFNNQCYIYTQKVNMYFLLFFIIYINRNYFNLKNDNAVHAHSHNIKERTKNDFVSLTSPEKNIQGVSIVNSQKTSFYEHEFANPPLSRY